MACTMQDLSKDVFINMANLTLARCDSYLDYLKAGVKQDTLTALRDAPLHTVLVARPTSDQSRGGGVTK